MNDIIRIIVTENAESKDDKDINIQDSHSNSLIINKVRTKFTSDHKRYMIYRLGETITDETKVLYDFPADNCVILYGKNMEC